MALCLAKNAFSESVENPKTTPDIKAYSGLPRSAKHIWRCEYLEGISPMKNYLDAGAEQILIYAQSVDRSVAAGDR